MGRKRKTQAYNIPENILNMVNEHSNKGWMLFTYDDFENFRLYCNFDDSTIMKSLKSDIGTWLDAMKQLETQSTLQGLIGPTQGSSSDDSQEFEG